MKLYANKITVAPIGNFVTEFPVDMLRYDSLIPYSEVDSGKIVRCIQKYGVQTREDFSIELWRRAPKHWVPTRDRWKSFLWKVVEHIII